MLYQGWQPAQSSNVQQCGTSQATAALQAFMQPAGRKQPQPAAATLQNSAVALTVFTSHLVNTFCFCHAWLFLLIRIHYLYHVLRYEKTMGKLNLNEWHILIWPKNYLLLPYFLIIVTDNMSIKSGLFLVF